MAEGAREPARARGRAAIRVARAVSVAAHPFATSSLLVAAASWQVAPGAPALRATALVVAAAVLPLALLMARQVARGRWTDVDASRPADRPLLYAVALVAIGALLGGLLLRDPGSFLVRGLAHALVLLAVAALATRRVKLSLHVAFAALAATALLLLGSPAGWALAALLPLLAWSRLALARHRPVEVVAGLALGVAGGVALALG